MAHIKDSRSNENSSITNTCENINSNNLMMKKIKEAYPDVEHVAFTESQPFPMKLMKILSIKDWEDIISWTPDGKSFIINDKEKLMHVISPSFYLGVTKYDSFRRKLNRWGFKVVKKGPYSGAFYHQYFERDNKSLCSKIIVNKNNVERSQRDSRITLRSEHQERLRNTPKEVVKKCMSYPNQKAKQGRANISIGYLELQHAQLLLNFFEHNLKNGNSLNQQQQQPMNNMNCSFDVMKSAGSNNFSEGTYSNNIHRCANDLYHYNANNTIVETSASQYSDTKYNALFSRSNTSGYRSCSETKEYQKIALKKKIKMRKDSEEEENVGKLNFTEENKVFAEYKKPKITMIDPHVKFSNAKAA